jgi:phosphoribosylamine-glycine ligase
VWINPKEKSDLQSGDGIVPKTRSWEDFVDWLEEGQNAHEPTLCLFDCSGLGDKADDVRKKGIHTIGGSNFCDKLEKNREYGMKIAQDAGMLTPHFESFSTITEAIKYAKRLRDNPTYFKCDAYIDANATYKAKDDDEMVEYLESVRDLHGDRLRCMIQDAIEGVAISTENWFNGKEFIGPCTGSIEKKKLLNEDIGPSTSCSLNTVWFYEEQEPQIAQKLNWSALAEVLREHNAPPGVYDANAIISPLGDAYFLEWCARFGYDTEPAGLALIGDYSQFLWHVATGQGDSGPLSKSVAYSVRLWTPPYPGETNPSETRKSRSCVGNHIFGVSSLWGVPFAGYSLQKCGDHYSQGSAYGYVGIALQVGRKLSVLNKACVEYAKTLRPHSLGYRTDGDKAIKKDAVELMKVLTDLPKGLVE